MPAQHRHASVDRHEPLGLAVLHYLSSAVRQHPHLLHLSSDAHFGADSSRAVRRHTSLVYVEYPPAQCVPHQSPGSPLITSRDTQQPSGPSHHTTESNKSPILPAVYRYSRRTSSSVMHTETRLGKRACHEGMTCRAYGIQLSPVGQLTQAARLVAPDTAENLPAQHRHASVDRNEPLGLAVFYEPLSAELH